MRKSKHKLVTLCILTTLAASVIYVINRMIAASALLKDMLHASEGNFYNWRFGKIYYKKRGKGKPILLVHDLVPGASSYEWSKIEKELSTKYTVYSIDLPGCGLSEKPKLSYTNFMYVQLLSDFVKNVIGQKTDVIASGYSSSFVIMACHNEKECFDRIIAVNPPSLNSLNQVPEKRSKLLKLIIEIPVFGTLIYNMITCKENLSDNFLEKYFYNPFHVEPETIDAYYESAHRNENAGKYLYASKIGKYTNISINHALKSIDNSIFIISGEQETNQQEITETYCSLNPSIETFTVSYTKHMPHMEFPEKFLEQISIYFS